VSVPAERECKLGGLAGAHELNAPVGTRWPGWPPSVTERTFHNFRQVTSFAFSSAGTLTPSSLYNADPTKSGVGSLTVKLPNGANLDVVANKVITSGRIAAT